MIFFCRKTSTADGRTRWSVCVPTLMGFTTIAWFYSEDLADNFIRHLESNEEDRRLASIWSEKLQQDRGLLENHWQDIQKVLEAYNRRIHELLRDTASYHSEAFTAIWNESFQELGAIPGLEKLAQTLHQQSRVLHSLKTEIAARVQQVMPATSQRLN